MAGCTKMDSQGLPLQLLLLVLTVAPGLDAHTGTTAAPYNANTSSEAAPNATVVVLGNVAQCLFQTGQMYRCLAEECWYRFLVQMDNVSKASWCDWRAIQRPYTEMRLCLEYRADKLGYGYPNAFAEYYTILIHHNFFFNCTEEHQFLDPPESVLLSLIITPICLIPFLVTLVVLKSKDGEMQL